MFINYKHLWCTILWAHMLGGAVETYVQHLCLLSVDHILLLSSAVLSK